MKGNQRCLPTVPLSQLLDGIWYVVNGYSSVGSDWFDRSLYVSLDMGYPIMAKGSKEQA